MGSIVISELAVDLIINIINILVLFVIVRTLAYKPVKKFLDARNEKIQNNINEAEALKLEAQKTVNEGDGIIADAQKKAEDIVTAAESRARQNAAEITARAQAAADETKAKAAADAETAREKLMLSAREDIASLACDMAGKILEREVSVEDNRKIIDDFFSKEGAQ